MRLHKDGKLYALKKSKREIGFSSGSPLVQGCRTRCAEVEKLIAMGDHPNIVSIKSSWEEGRRLYILCELCQQSLKDYLATCTIQETSLSEEVIIRFAADMLAGTMHMHKLHVMHLDLKPANMLLTAANQLKIADFGLAYAKGDRADPEEGDSLYMAPELLYDRFGPAADIFSLGVTLYEMANLAYELPRSGPGWEKLRSGKPGFPEWAYSDALRAFIVRMLDPNPDTRPEAAALLADPLIQSVSLTVRTSTWRGSSFLQQLTLPTTNSL